MINPLIPVRKYLHSQCKGWTELSNSMLTQELISAEAAALTSAGPADRAQVCTAHHLRRSCPGRVLGVTHNLGCDLEVPLGPAAPWAQPQVAAVAVPAPSSQCAAASPLRAGHGEGSCPGTQGSTGFWPAQATSHPSSPVAENLTTAFSPLELMQRTGSISQPQNLCG